MLHVPFSADPIAASWMIVLAAMLMFAVVIPIARALLATVLYVIASLTGDRHLRSTASRVMPRIGHLIGGVALGIVSIATPAFASSHAPGAVNSIDLGRDAGGATKHLASEAAGNKTAHVTSKPAPQASTVKPAPSDSPSEVSADKVEAGSTVYVVRSGDTLWDIAEAQLETPSDAQITETWKKIWKANRTTIGEHPELILPGQILYLDGISA